MNKKIMGLCVSLLGLILVYIGTYAYYMRVVNGTITGNTGAFVFDVLHNDESFSSIDLYNTIESPSVTSSEVIVPGDEGKFVLKASGVGSDVDIEYSIIFNGTNVPANMKFYLDEGKTKVLDVQTNKINGYLDISESTSKEHTIYWEWPYDSGENNDLDYEYANKSISISVKVEGKQSDGILIYGVKRDRNSTGTEWERVEDSVGLVANAVLPGSTSTENDFDNIYPWSDIKSYNYDAKTKKVTAWYGDSNFKFDGSNGEVLTYIPGFYYKREVIDDIEYQYISQYEIEGYSYSEPFSVGRYKISKVEDEISSRSGVLPLVSSTISQFRELATNFGSEFSQMDWHYYVIQMLYLIEYADYDVQAKIGYGVVTPANIAEMGGTDSLGMKSGCLVNDRTGSSIYRGMEDLYSFVFEFIDGVNIKAYQAYINYNYKTYCSDTFSGDYKSLGYINASGNGYITKLGYDSNNPLIGLPTAITSGFTESDYNISIKDAAYVANKGERILAAGGCFFIADVSSVGLWFSYASLGSDYSYGDVGARLIKHQTSGGRG